MNSHLWYLSPYWGHMGPGITLIAASLAANPTLKVRLIFHACIKDQLIKALIRYPPDDINRLELLPVGDPELHIGKGLQDVVGVISEASEGAIEYLKSLASKPSLVVLDQSCTTSLYTAARKYCPGVQIWLAFSSCPSLLCSYLDIKKRIDDGEDDETVIEYMKYRNGNTALTGVEVNVPGLPAMYDYERDDANLPAPATMLPFILEMVKTSFAVDGIALSASHAIQAASIEHLKDTITVAAMGCLVDSRAWNGSQVKDPDTQEWLDRHGENEVILVSFGSMHFPEEAKLSILLDALISSEKPFVFASAKASLQHGCRQRIRGAGNAFLIEEFFDQIGTLNHPSVGWFITHGGWNSVQEAMVIGKPMVVWPLQHGDQQISGALVSTRQDPIGFEFLQIRNWRGPTKRGVQVEGTPAAMRREFDQVLRKAYGREGKQLRANIRCLSKRIRAERSADAKAIADFASM